MLDLNMFNNLNYLILVFSVEDTGFAVDETGFVR